MNFSFDENDKRFIRISGKSKSLKKESIISEIKELIETELPKYGMKLLSMIELKDELIWFIEVKGETFLFTSFIPNESNPHYVVLSTLYQNAFYDFYNAVGNLKLFTKFLPELKTISKELMKDVEAYEILKEAIQKAENNNKGLLVRTNSIEFILYHTDKNYNRNKEVYMYNVKNPQIHRTNIVRMSLDLTILGEVDLGLSIDIRKL